MPLRIAIFDDNKNIRDSIDMLLKTEKDLEVVGSFSHVLDCLEDVAACKPDVILMDIEMPGMKGIEAVKIIKKELPEVLILMQTVFEDDDNVFDSICAGAAGYILKNFLNTKLIDSIKELEFGGSPMSPTIARKVLAKMQQIPQWFHRLRGCKRNHSQSFAKEISPMGAGVNASRRGSRFNSSRSDLFEDGSSGSNGSSGSPPFGLPSSHNKYETL